jgi:hypothetical protein
MTDLEKAQAELLQQQALSIKREDARKSLTALQVNAGVMNNKTQAYKDVYQAISDLAKFLAS